MKLKLRVKKRKLKAFIKEKYNLDIKSMKIIPLGENSYSYILKDKRRKEYFMKVLVKRQGENLNLEETKKRLKDNLFLMLRCKLDFISYPIVTLNGEYLIEFENHPIILYKYLDGKGGDWKFNAKELEDYGEKLGALHKCGKLIPKKMYGGDKIDLKSLEQKIKKQLKILGEKTKDKQRKKLQKLIVPKKDQIMKILKELKSSKQKLNFTKENVLTHGDAIAENLLIHKNKVSIIDLDDLAFAPREKDLWLYVSKDFYTPFMNGYKKVYPREKLKKKLVLFYLKLRLMRDLSDFMGDVLEKTNIKEMRKVGVKQVKDYIVFELNRFDEKVKEIKELL